MYDQFSSTVQVKARPNSSGLGQEVQPLDFHLLNVHGELNLRVDLHVIFYNVEKRICIINLNLYMYLFN